MMKLLAKVVNDFQLLIDILTASMFMETFYQYYLDKFEKFYQRTLLGDSMFFFSVHLSIIIN